MKQLLALRLNQTNCETSYDVKSSVLDIVQLYFNGDRALYISLSCYNLSKVFSYQYFVHAASFPCFIFDVVSRCDAESDVSWNCAKQPLSLAVLN
jgi:hypothetical protein